MPNQNILGAWDKVSTAGCAAQYPHSIRFESSGLYFGESDPPGEFTQWDAGTHEITGPDTVKISTANDAVITYRFSVDGETLKFVDPDGCEFSYRKVA